MRVLGVGTYRDVELDVTRPLAATMDRMVRARTVQRFTVKRFDRADLVRMIHALAGQAPPDRLVDVIFDETAGNPFFIEEVFRHLLEEGRIFDAAGAFRTDIHVDELDVPESIRLVVGRRLDRLGAEAQKALGAAAVVGRGFSFSLLEAITEVDPGHLLNIVEDAEAARVIVPEERNGQVHYTFAHELIRQTLLTSLSMLRRQRLHLAVADAMERLYRDTPLLRPSEIAAHLMQAGASADADRTMLYLEQAADQAMESAAFEDALRAIDDALTLVGDRDPLRRARLRERQGEAIRIFGRFDEGLDIWDEVVDAYRETGECDAAGDLCWRIGYQFIWLNRFPEAFASYARGLEIVGGEPTKARAALLGSIGQLTAFAGLYDAGVAQLAEAEQVAREAGDDRVIGLLLWDRCVVDWSFLQLQTSVEAGQRAVEHLRAARDGWMLADALCWLSFPLSCGGDFAAADAAATKAHELSIRLGHLAGQVLSGRALSLVQAPKSGDLDQVEEVVRNDLELCVRLQSPWSSQSYAWLCWFVTQRGKLDEGLAYAEEALRLEPVSSWSGLGWASRLTNRAYAGDRVAVDAMLREKLDTLRDVAGPAIAMGTGAMLTAAGEASALLGLADVAADLYQPIAGVAEHLVMQPFSYLLTQRVAGMVAAASAQWDHAQRHFGVALEQARSLPNLLEQPNIEHYWAKMLLDRGDPADPTRAAELLDAAVAGYRRNRATLGEERAARLRARV